MNWNARWSAKLALSCFRWLAIRIKIASMHSARNFDAASCLVVSDVMKALKCLSWILSMNVSVKYSLENHFKFLKTVIFSYFWHSSKMSKRTARRELLGCKKVRDRRELRLSSYLLSIGSQKVLHELVHATWRASRRPTTSLSGWVAQSVLSMQSRSTASLW